MALLRAGDGWAWGAASEPGVNGVNQSRQLVVGSQKGASPCQATCQGPQGGTWLWPKGSDTWRCVLGTQLVQTPPQNIGKGSWTASRRELGPFGSPRMGAGRECAELRALGCCSIPMVWGMRNWPSSGAAGAPFLAPFLAPGHPQHRCPHAVPCHQPGPRATQQLGQKAEMFPDLGMDDAGLLEHPAAHAVVSLPQRAVHGPRLLQGALRGALQQGGRVPLRRRVREPLQLLRGLLRALPTRWALLPEEGAPWGCWGPALGCQGLVPCGHPPVAAAHLCAWSWAAPACVSITLSPFCCFCAGGERGEVAARRHAGGEWLWVPSVCLWAAWHLLFWHL